MEARPQAHEPEPQQQKKEPIVSRTTLIIVAVFLVVNIGIIGVFFVPKFFGPKKEGEAPVNVSPLDRISVIELGRLEITKPIDPLQQNFMRCSVTVTLIVPADRAAQLEAKIKKFEAKFKEISRRAFLDADPRDVSTENLAGVKNTIRTRINEMLGDDSVEEVVFGDFRPY